MLFQHAILPIWWTEVWNDIYADGLLVSDGALTLDNLSSYMIIRSLQASHNRYSKLFPGKLMFTAPESLVQYVVHDYAIINSTEVDSGDELIKVEICKTGKCS